MRTTLTLDHDVAKMLRDLSVKTGASFKSTVNRALRKGLAGEAPREKRDFRVIPYPMGLRSGFDSAGFNKLADELETEAFLESTRPTKVRAASARA